MKTAELGPDVDVPLSVRRAFDTADRYFPTPLQQFQFFDKYSRFNVAVGRRETWVEAVDRAVAYLHELAGDRLAAGIYDQIRRSILEMRAMPSMRLLAMAGVAASRNNVTIYNCAYLPVDSLDSFVEALLICMNGCGVGFSVESQYVSQLPPIAKQTGGGSSTLLVDDTTEGCAYALRCGLAAWFAGEDLNFDLSNVRPAGAPLLIKGGRASGPRPLRRMLQLVRSRVLRRQDGFLTSLDAHDIMCAIGGLPIAGGVRPGIAMISLFDSSDDEMRFCKDDVQNSHNQQRWNANNSLVWDAADPTKSEITHYVQDMVKSARGEPGIFNRRAAIESRPSHRSVDKFGTNPCGETVLRPWQFCNLSSAIARRDDSIESLREKVELAAAIGTIQSLATYFPGLRSRWKENCEDERLLGVDITGQMDCPAVQQSGAQAYLRGVAIETNQRIAARLGIRQAAAVTCVKPSGNSSQLVDCSPGIHARWAAYYIRNVRVFAHSPIFKVLREAGAPMDPENGQSESNATTWVVHFPVTSPKGAVTRSDRCAIEQCEYWLLAKGAWADHNVSCTVTYQRDEVSGLIEWIWENRHVVQGLTFLPSQGFKYSQPPYVEISASEYEQRMATFPHINYSELYRYESSDQTSMGEDLACSGPCCDV